VRVADRQQVASWLGVSAVISASMLLTVWISAGIWNAADARSGMSSLLLRPDHSFEDFLRVLGRNALVLAIHFLACYVGALIGRPHRPSVRFGPVGRALNCELPPWAGRLALLYALAATLTSVGVQATGLGLVLSDMSAATGLSHAEMLALTLPHAVPELLGVFTPLGLFLIAARSGQLRELALWSWQSLTVAVPLIVIAAFIETYVSPGLIHAVVFGR
jgi:hypothetical protein